MQLRCTYCQTMFAISREEKLIAIQNMQAGNLTFYHADCPKCRRANRIERVKMERSYPNWQADLNKLSETSPEAVEPAGSKKKTGRSTPGKKE